MPKVMVQVEVDQVTNDLAQGIQKFLVDLVKSQKDGFQAIQDAAIIGAAVIADLVPVAGNFAKLGVSMAESESAFMTAWFKAGIDAYKALGGK